VPKGVAALNHRVIAGVPSGCSFRGRARGKWLAASGGRTFRGDHPFGSERSRKRPGLWPCCAFWALGQPARWAGLGKWLGRWPGDSIKTLSSSNRIHAGIRQPELVGPCGSGGYLPGLFCRQSACRCHSHPPPCLCDSVRDPAGESSGKIDRCFRWADFLSAHSYFSGCFSVFSRRHGDTEKI